LPTSLALVLDSCYILVNRYIIKAQSKAWSGDAKVEMRKK